MIHEPTQQPPELLDLEATPPGPPEPDTWDMGDFILILLAYFASQLLIFSLLSAFVPKPEGLTRKYFGVITTLLADALIIGLFFLRGRGVRRMSWEDLGFRGVSWQLVSYWGVIFFVSVFAFNFVYGAILKWFGLGPPSQEVATFFSPDLPWSFKILALLVVIIFAPLSEELLYRGVLFPAVRHYLSPIMAAIPCGLIFGALHFEVMTIIPLGFLGFLLCYIFHQTRSLWLCIGLHAANNVMAYFWLLFVQKYFQS